LDTAGGNGLITITYLINQVPASACVTPPSKLKLGKTKTLLKANCLTNASQLVTVTVAAKKGSASVKVKKGATVITAKKKHRKITVTWTAPSSSLFNGYSFVKTYKT
ncbi:MAG: hypothetical protein WCI74_18325, partial [Actinomycetes bacterium]